LEDVLAPGAGGAGGNASVDQYVLFGDQTFAIEQIQTCLIGNRFTEEFIDEEILDGEVLVFEEGGEQFEVLAETIPEGLLPNTGGISPFAVLAALGSALVVAGLSARYAVVRRRS